LVKPWTTVLEEIKRFVVEDVDYSTTDQDEMQFCKISGTTSYDLEQSDNVKGKFIGSIASGTGTGDADSIKQGINSAIDKGAFN
jgi:hypothetical protein